jgi:DNA (cytosine-5)-methyltransferase 1
MATFGSLFAGVGGIDIGFDNAGGWECKFQVEWDKHCQETLKYHWPEVPKWGDVSDVNGAELPPVDLITFGSPCQDLSLAGKRAGMVEGSRSNLFFEATRIIKEMRNATGNVSPRWAIWENVPGAFSSNNGDDFEAVIQEMVDIGGHHVEWHCVDAQFFGVPQRRRRVFVIACFDSAILSRSGQEVLPVSEGRRRNTSARNSKRKALAATLGESIDPSSQQSIDEQLPWAAGSTDDDVLTTSVTSKWHKGTGGPSGSEHYNLVVEPFVKVVRSGARDAEGTLPAEVWRGNEVAPTLNVFDNTGESRATVVIAEPILIDGTRVDDVRIYQSPVQTLAARMGTGGNNVPMVATDDSPILMRQREEKPVGGKGPLLSDTSLTLAGSNDQVLFQPNAIPIQDGREIEKHQNGLGVGNEGDPSYTLDQTGAQAVAYPIQGTIIGRSDKAGPQGRGVGEDGDPMYTLDTISAHGVAHTTADVVGTLQARDYKGIGNQYVAENKLIIEEDIAPTFKTLDMVVRRLTPIECERLMGWPENHTLHRADGKQNSDTTRYKMCGNGVASPVAQWIAEHILNVDRTF